MQRALNAVGEGPWQFTGRMDYIKIDKSPPVPAIRNFSVGRLRSDKSVKVRCRSKRPTCVNAGRAAWFTQLRWAAAHHYLEPCTFEVEVSSDASSWQHVSCESIQVLCPVFSTCLHTGKPRRIREFGGIALKHSLLCMTE